MTVVLRLSLRLWRPLLPVRTCRLSTAAPVRFASTGSNGADTADNIDNVDNIDSARLNRDGGLAPKPDAVLALPRFPGRLIGAAAIVTGASRGIGWAIAARLAREGVACTLVGRDEAALQRAIDALPPTRSAPLAQMLPSSHAAAESAENAEGVDSVQGDDGDAPTETSPSPPLQHKYIVGDVREGLMWQQVFSATPEARFLINAAGITHSVLLARQSPSEIRDLLDVNLYGTTLGCRAAMRHWMRRRGEDHCIINIGSLLGQRGGYGAATYAASKAGLIGLTRAVAEECAGRHVRSNIILPGYISTDMTARMTLGEVIKRIPSRRLGRAEEVADAAAFLAKNRYANNCVLNLDGGLSAIL